MSSPRAVPVFVSAVVAMLFFGVGNYLGARQADDNTLQFAELRAEVNQLRRRPVDASGTAGAVAAALRESEMMVSANRAALIADVKRQLQDEMGLLPLTLLRERKESFVELHANDDRGSSSYGTAGYLGEGYFITVKHGVIALGQHGVSAPRKIVSVRVIYKGRALAARVVDSGDAAMEVEAGDWAIVKVREAIDLPPLNVNLAYGFAFADPIFRLGNDYSKGIMLGTGYVGQRTPNNLVTCLTDGHPGVSGGGVLNQSGELVGIPVGRMQDDYRFSFILPLRQEMFRKVDHLKKLAAG